MAMLGRSFNAAEVAPSTGEFKVIPAGDYLAQIINSEISPTKGGEALVLNFDVLDGEHQGHKIKTWLNIGHRDPSTADRANRDLSAVCHAVGRLNISDSEELHYLPMIISVRVTEPRTDKDTGKKYGPGNAISAFKAASGHGAQPVRGGFQPRQASPVAAAPAYAAPATPAQAPVAAAGNRPAPWSRKAG